MDAVEKVRKLKLACDTFLFSIIDLGVSEE